MHSVLKYTHCGFGHAARGIDPRHLPPQAAIIQSDHRSKENDVVALRVALRQDAGGDVQGGGSVRGFSQLAWVRPHKRSTRYCQNSVAPLRPVYRGSLPPIALPLTSSDSATALPRCTYAL
jgi:hypothetical protein